MQRYAMIGPDGRPRRIVSGQKPHDEALPVEYPQLSVTRTTHKIKQKDPSEWDVQPDKVVVTYETQPKWLEEEREKKRDVAKYLRDQRIEEGFTITLNGNEARITLDRVTVERVDQASLDAERRPDGWTKRWRIAPGVWTDIDATQIEAIRAGGADHVEACFQAFEPIENAIDAATDLASLEAVDIYSGYPET